jgi:putative ABC transport system permease protein
MRIPLFSGQGCTSQTAWNTAVVNRSFVQAFFPAQSLVGHHITWAQNPYRMPPAEIRGVAADARESGVNHVHVPIVYWCANNPEPSPYFLVRTQTNPASFATSIRKAIQRIEPVRSVFDIVPLEQQLYESSSENRLRTLLLSLFALTAILLASIGLYGTLTYFVSVRHREVGLRIALGAVPSQLLRRFLWKGLGGAFAGCLVGLALAGAFSRMLAGMLYGISRADAASYLGVAIVVLLVAAAASVIPAARAAQLDATRALRDD